ncbi:prepilin-type N-terminal cleavage/methylation domain-containing protein [Halanaerobium saccharolyticum]|jgi:prepilin-type N-terminal cleavage/methylation domain-containing protein|uniref:Prepilin-type N-terminal cleavage/methylation domain-containing protein n=1 Tax=Halanaerobium saccharolyticum TaxID=43595 RepID=A0A2T5RJX8_9FIRM|nr:prepilin-type N-terminal cleavage/methylation domain-containing protein [Halanaerobium saccharolyticum]PTV99089.1 prepilin-type N-terminal cleavage/methylation domain-containing protein [Halanaerobium saccharolyticum]
MNKNEHLVYNNGITLIEILMAVIILGAVMSIATPMIIQTFNIVEDSSVRITKNRMADIMLEDISKYFRSAVSYDKNTINGLDIYEFEAFSPQDGNRKNYKIIETSDSKLEFRENGNLIRKIDNVDDFNINEDNPPLYIFKLRVIIQSEEIIKQFNLDARNIPVENE